MDIRIVPMNRNIIECIKHIDDECYTDGYDVGIDWYIDAYSKLSEIVVALDKHKIIVGYCGITGIKQQVYECYKAGLLKGDVSLSSNSYVELEQANYFYLFMLALLPDYRGNGIGKKLYKVSMKNIKKYKGNIIAYCNEASRHILKDFKEVTRVSSHYIMEHEA